MHYANGREAKNGDTVLQMMYGKAVIGVIYDAVVGNDFCNGTLAPLGGGQHIGACLADCVHINDIYARIPLDVKQGNLREQLAKIPVKE